MKITEPTFDLDYSVLVKDVINTGDLREPAREGMPPTKAIFGTRIKVQNVSERFPLLTTKKMGIKNVLTELIWFLKGDTNIKYLVQNKCNIWNEDAYKYYKRICDFNKCTPFLTEEEFVDHIKNDRLTPTHETVVDAKYHELSGFEGNKYKLGDLGRVYGACWDNMNGYEQIKNLLKGIDTQPFSRYHVVSAWNPVNHKFVALPPCHILFQFYCYEKKGEKMLDVQFYMRSIDIGLGLPYNMASYSAMLVLFAGLTGRKAGNVIFIGGDTHIYENHEELLLDQVQREPSKIDAKLEWIGDVFKTGSETDIMHYIKNDLNVNDFVFSNYESHPAVPLTLSVGV